MSASVETFAAFGDDGAPAASGPASASSSARLATPAAVGFSVSGSCQSIGVRPSALRNPFALLKCRQPKKPLSAERGDGCAACNRGRLGRYTNTHSGAAENERVERERHRQHMVLLGIYYLALGLSWLAPQKEHDTLPAVAREANQYSERKQEMEREEPNEETKRREVPLLVYSLDGGVCELLPPLQQCSMTIPL